MASPRQPPRKKVILQNEPTEPEQESIRPPTSVGIPSGNARSSATLWHFNGAGIDVIWLVLNLGQGKLTEHGLGHCIGSHGDYFRAIRDC